MNAMVGRFASASAAPVLSQDQGGTDEPETSYEKFFRPFDMHGYRRRFPELWAGFLRAHFRDAQHIAFMFSVTDRTAQNWLNCVGSPRPEFAIAAVARFPGALQALIGEAA